MLADDPTAAAAICTETLGVDRFLDPAWRLLIAAQQQQGDEAGAAQARRRYDEVLEELGVRAGAADRNTGVTATAR